MLDDKRAMSTKQLILDAIHRLPDDADFVDVSDEIALLAALREGDEALAAGQVLANDEMKRRIESWLTE